MKQKTGAASEGLIIIIFLMLFVAAFAFMLTGFVNEVGISNNVEINSTVMNNVDMYNKTSSTLYSMKSKFIDEQGNARTGLTTIVDTLFSGIGGIITVLFSAPSLFTSVISQIAFSLLGLSGGALANIVIFGLIAIAIIATVYMISRR